MFQIGDKVQFVSKKRKSKVATEEVKGILSLLALPHYIFGLQGVVDKVGKETLHIKFPGKPPFEEYFKTFIVPRELIKVYELESNHPITRIFL